MNGEAAPDWAKKKRQPYRKGNPFVADLYAKLQLSTALRKEHYNIIINTDDKLVKLLCLLCLAQLAVSNITQQRKDHSGCAACLAAQRLRGLHAGAPLPPPPNSYQPTVPPSVLNDVKQELALFFYTSELSPNDKWNDEKSTADVKSEEALNVAYHGLSKLSAKGNPPAACLDVATTSFHHANGFPPTASTYHAKGRPPTASTYHANGRPPTASTYHAKGRPPTASTYHANGRPPTASTYHAKGRPPTASTSHANGRPPTASTYHANGRPPTASTYHANGRPPTASTYHANGRPPTASTYHANGRPPTASTYHANGRPPTASTYHAKGHPPTASTSHANGRPPTASTYHANGRPPTASTYHANGRPPTASTYHANGRPPTASTYHANGRPPTASTSHANGRPPTASTYHANGRPPTASTYHAKGRPPTASTYHAKGRPPTASTYHAKGRPPRASTSHANGRPPTASTYHANGRPPTASTYHAKGRPPTASTYHANGRPPTASTYHANGRPPTPMTQPHALCPTMQAGEAGRAQPAHRMPEAHAPAIHDWPAVTQPHALCPTMQAGEAGRAQPAHRMPEAHAPAIHDWPAVTQPHALCPTMQAGEAGRAQPAHRMPAAHAPATHDTPAMTQPRVQCPTMQAGEAGGAHHVPTEHAPTIHAGTLQPCEAQPAKEQTGMPYPCMLMDTSKEGGTIADKTYNTLVLYKDALHDRKQAYLQWKGMHGILIAVACAWWWIHHHATLHLTSTSQSISQTISQSQKCLRRHCKRLQRWRAISTTSAFVNFLYIDGTIDRHTAILNLTVCMHSWTTQGHYTVTVGKSSVIAHHYNTTLQRHTIYRITILDKQRRPTNAITMDHLKTAIEWLGTLSTSYCAMAITYIAWLLLACGDVEANPGPNTHYVQQEGSSTCQADSLNNLAGRKWVSIDAIDTFYAQRLTQLNTPDELAAWQMARGAGGYDDGVIDLYLTSKYGLISTSVADLRRPQDWTKHNLDSLAQRYETTAFLCKRLGHSMAMTSLNGKWSLKDSLEPAPTPLARIALPTKQTHHQLFIITPTHTTRTSAQIALCHTKKINHIISHTNHNTSPPVPIYMEAQHKCFCLVHAINMAMGRPLINPHDVLTHCSHLATHLQDLASRARGENRHIPLPDRTPHIYDEDGNFNIHSMNHYLYHNYKTFHLATQELPQDNITRATLSTLMGKEDNHTSNAAILINRNHATTLRYLDNTWYWLDPQATQARRLLTTADWKELQGRLILIKQGMQHKNLIEPIFWLADPMEQATTTQLEHHYARPHHIDLSGHDDQPPTIPPPAATPHPLTTSNNAPKRKNAYAEADPPARSRHREDANAKEDAATPPPPTRNEKPSTKTGPKKPRSKKGAKNTSHSKDRHTQTLMSRYLTNTQAAPTATIPSPPVPCPTTKAPPILPTQPHQTPSRQYLTLTTLNVRGLYRARRDVSHLIHHHHPDILILTETKTHHKKDTPGWLKVTTQDYTLHRHGGHSEVLIGIKHDLAIQMQATLVPPSTEAEINSRCVILTLSQHHSENLTIVATYWPSGCNEDALPLRENMQHHIRTATGHLPGSLILAGDLNATMKTEDRSEHTEYIQDRMMREFASEMRLSEADPGDRAWTYQQPHCNSRIDAILTRDARPGPEHRTIVDTHAYLSDHRPLIATLTTARMGIHLAQTQQAQSHKHTVLTTPITNSDREAFRLAVQQPSSGAPQLHARLAAYLSPLFTEATDFLANLDKANPHQPKRLTELAGLHPRQAVDMAATMLTTLLETCRATAMKTCTTKTLTRGGQHYQRRTMCRIRLALGKKLKTTRNLSRQARLLFKQNGAHPTIEDLIPDTDTRNTAIREAVLARQDDDPTTDNHVQAALAKLTNSYRDQIHQLDDDDSALAIAQARVRMQQLISTQPKKANKYILRPSRTSHKGLQALTDPATRRVCTDPADLNRIITAAYGQKLSPPTPKTGHYTDTQTRNYPWARAKADDPFTMHTCKNIHWMHTAIMDKASFQECLSRLAGGKAPGPDGIENEIIKMLPWEMRDTIHQLFITMWATGCTPTTWKTSDTCLLYKDKGQETDLNAYRPVGLANTIYKLWTSLITKTLYEYAEANGMLSKCQAGFRSHRDTTQQLQMLVMALEDAKLAKADIYALMVDFTSAFNTTCQDKLLWIMHDLGFPTDATDAVKDLYTGATTRFKTPYGPTDPVPVDRGTIQGDSLSPFLFLIYIEPLLRWLQVGARGYKFQSVENDSDNRYTIGSIDYADDVAILCNSISNTRVQADKLSAYSDWGHLIISHSKTLATAALHKAHQSGRCSTQADAEKEARKQMQDLRLQGKPVTFLRPTAPFTYLGVMLTMTLNWKPQHTAMITQLRQKLDRLRRSFASARQAIHIVKTAIIPSLAYSFCVVPCTPGDLDLFDRAVNQCVKHKLNLPLGTPNAVVRDDIDKLGLGISSAAQEYHARNTTALVSSLQSADNTYAHISRCMLHKQITWLYAQAAKHGHRIPNLLQHTLRARQLLHTTTANLFATHEGAPLYPKETKALGQLITQSASPLPRDIVSACITCLKSLGLAHPSELICQDNIHIMSGDSLRKRFGTKVKQKHIIALNRLTAMATMDHCPTATEAKTILGRRDTTLTLPADQRRIRAWAAGLTELTPHTTAHTGPRYTDIRAYMTAKTLAKDTQPPTPNPITATARSKLTNNVPKPPTAKQPTPQPRIGSKRPAEDRHTEAEDRHTQTIPDVVTHIPIMTLANLSTWKADTARQHKNEQLGIMLGAMYDHQESITAIDGWHWNGNNQESYYNVHWRPTIIEKWALQMYKKEGYTPAHTEDICRANAEHVCTCELCWEPKEDSPMCNNCMRAYHPACLAKTGLAGQARDDHWLCPVCAHGEDDLKTAMRKSVETDLIKAHWHPTTEPKPLILAHIDYTDKKNEYDADNSKRQEARRRPLDAALPEHTRQGLPDPHTWIPRCTDLHSRATFHTSPVDPQTDIVGTGRCEITLQNHSHITTQAMCGGSQGPNLPQHSLIEHVVAHDEAGRTVGLVNKTNYQNLTTWLQHTPHPRDPAMELAALLRRNNTQSTPQPLLAAQNKAITTLYNTQYFPSTVQRWANPLTVRAETTTYWSPDINDTAYGAHHNCLLVRHTGLSTWNVPAEDALALKCIKHAIHSATMEEATATILLIPGKKGISYPKHIAMLKSYPEHCQHLATIPLDKSKAATKSCKHATLLTYIVWNKAGQQLVTKGNPQGWLANTATALHPRPERHPKHNQPSKHVQPTQLPSGHYKHMHLPADRELPATGHMRQPNQIAPPLCTTSSMVIPNWRTVTYTDGSCMQGTDRAPSRKVGAGVYTPENDERLTIALPDHSTINRAELVAIHAAIKSGATHIATDSLCSIYQIRRALANPMSLRTHHHRDILADIATLIMNSRDTIHLRKVRAHSGIIGNEAADTLAKHAAMYPEQAHTQAPHEHTEQQTWLSATTETGTTIPLPDCRHSVRTHMRAKHKLGLANQDSIYYQMSQDIARVAAKGSCERVMLDPGIPTAAQRTALLYRTGGLYNQKLAMRWGKAADDRCPLCGEADSATHLLSGCTRTAALVQERHNGAGRLITKAIIVFFFFFSTCAAERNWSAWGRLFADALRSSMDMATAEKLVFIQTNDELATNSDNFDKYNVPEDPDSDIEDRDEALQPDLTEAQRNRKVSGEARAARDRDNTFHGRKAKLAHLIDHLPQELWDAFLADAVQPRVEAISERGVLASLLLGLLVKKQAQKRWPDRILALAYGAASFSGSGSIGWRGVPVSQMRKEAVKQFGAGRVVLVDEFRTSRVSSAYSHPSEALPGQPPESFRWLRPVYSEAKRSQVRGLMSSTSYNIRFYDRDVSAALNIRRCAVGPGPRPTELCYWDGRPAMPKPGRPGQEWVYLRDKALLRKWRRKWRR
ncbi:hypothetical protein QJQ45_003065 [Haematococcus lacustris]|nr:hypothetical protein QJQ45_003065 [Haematococcus lacustris]